MSETIRVLLVEDSPEDVVIVRRVLARYQLAQFETTLVGSTSECLAEIAAHRPDVVLLDNGLPGEDGLSFLRRLSRLVGFPPVVMLTGQGDPKMAVEAIRAGAQDYYPKEALSSDMLGRVVHQAVERFRLDEELRQGNEQVIFALADAVESKDSTTGDHLHRMRQHAAILGQHIGLDEHELLVLRYAATLHDIGKISVSDTILTKPAALTESEWEEMRKHPLIGERLCAPLRFADEIQPVIRHHHERWDGKGYVDGLAGEEIPMLARLVGVVDTFDAMSNDRPYRQALSLTKCIQELKRVSGSQLDPDLTCAFIRVIEDGLIQTALAA
jgi:putative two-component system response regulator